VPLHGYDGKAADGAMPGAPSVPARSAEVVLAEEVAHRAAIATEHARLYAETQQAVRLREEFLASISHDLRSPLATVKGSAQLIQRRLARLAQTESDAAFARQLADGIIGAATMAEVIDQLLDLARQDAHKPLTLDPQETDLAGLVRAAVDGAQTLATWDPLRLRRVLDNLIGNALKYGANGEVRVRLERAKADCNPAASPVASRERGGYNPAQRRRIAGALKPAVRRAAGSGAALAGRERGAPMRAAIF
jgi:signal transduction histidine kinase